MQEKVYKKLAALIVARENCLKSDDISKFDDVNGWAGKHKDRIEQIVSDYMPSGSGFDSGTTLDFDLSKPDKLVFNTSFHHMDGESGCYDGWTEHVITVKPSLAFDFVTSISGRNRNDIKDYIAEQFDIALHSMVDNSV